MALRGSSSNNDRGVDLDLVTTGHKRITVMIVDDEPETVRMIKTILMGSGMDVIGAESGLDAIDKCPHTQPDVILLDLMMPDMDGYETIKIIRERGYALPVVALTAHAMQADKQRCLDAGMDAYLS